MGSVIILSFVKGKTAHGETHGRYLALDSKKPRDVARGRRIGKTEPENSLFQEIDTRRVNNVGDKES